MNKTTKRIIIPKEPETNENIDLQMRTWFDGLLKLWTP